MESVEEVVRETEWLNTSKVGFQSPPTQQADGTDLDFTTSGVKNTACQQRLIQSHVTELFDVNKLIEICFDYPR